MTVLTAAACAGMDPDLFFPGRPSLAARPRAVCQGCPVRVPCLLAALASGDSYGIRGGLTAAERRPLSAFLTGRQAAAVLRAADEAREAGRPRGKAAAAMTVAAEAAAGPGPVPPDPDAAEHRGVLLRELAAWEAARRGRNASHREAPVAGVPPPGRSGDVTAMTPLKMGRNEAIRHRRAGLPVPEAVAELEREFWRQYKRGRRAA